MMWQAANQVVLATRAAECMPANQVVLANQVVPAKRAAECMPVDQAVLVARAAEAAGAAVRRARKWPTPGVSWRNS